MVLRNSYKWRLRCLTTFTSMSCFIYLAVIVENSLLYVLMNLFAKVVTQVVY